MGLTKATGCEEEGQGPKVARHRNYARSKVQVKFLNLRRVLRS